ncbi:hypothetical protein Q8F55_001536 [Vanrija albida]|uniref:MARVEL domain-containing protein n=1 Tax=Vanrija albida TaxID=181172 RepID=A0ABR3QGC1_9TREE
MGSSSYILPLRRALYFAAALVLFATLGVAAALVHKWRIGGSIWLWVGQATTPSPNPADGYRILPIFPIAPSGPSGSRPRMQIKYHLGPSITVLVWTAISSLYLIGFYFAPVSPPLFLETLALCALVFEGVVSMGYLTSYWPVFFRGTNHYNYRDPREKIGIATLILGWVAVALLLTLLVVEYVYARVQLRTQKAEDVWPRRLVDVVARGTTPKSPIDEYSRLIPEREREPPEASHLADVFSPSALKLVASGVIALTAAATVGLDGTLLVWFLRDGPLVPYPAWPPEDSLNSEHFSPAGPIVVLVFAVLAAAFTVVRPGLTLSIRTEARITGLLTALGITTMSILSTYWPLFNPYVKRSLQGVGIATLVTGWIAAGALLFLLVLELLVVLRSVREGVEGVGNATFTELVHGKTLWWVYVPEEHPSWHAQLSAVAEERERQGAAPEAE